MLLCQSPREMFVIRREVNDVEGKYHVQIVRCVCDSTHGGRQTKNTTCNVKRGRTLLVSSLGTFLVNLALGVLKHCNLNSWP